MSACTSGTSSNPHEAIDGGRVGVSADLKNAAIGAHGLNRDILSQIDPSAFTGTYSFLPSDSTRRSAETPAMKDGNSYWGLQTSSSLKKDTDVAALFIQLRTYLESRGFKLIADDHKTSAAGVVVGGADFTGVGDMRSVHIYVNGGPDYKKVSIKILTQAFPNPPMHEWPDWQGQELEWTPTALLWPEGLSPTPTPSSSPGGHVTP